jgi:hypothetical protein
MQKSLMNFFPILARLLEVLSIRWKGKSVRINPQIIEIHLSSVAEINCILFDVEIP